MPSLVRQYMQETGIASQPQVQPQSPAPEPTGKSLVRGYMQEKGLAPADGGSDFATAHKQYLGRPYVHNVQDPKKGFDCSLLNQTIYKQFGINLPRTAQAQHDSTKRITRDQLQPGDLVFFKGTRRDGKGGITHTGYYIGNGRFAHASTGSMTVIEDSLDTPYNKKHLAGFGQRPGSAQVKAPSAVKPQAVTKAAPAPMPVTGTPKRSEILASYKGAKLSPAAVSEIRDWMTNSEPGEALPELLHDIKTAHPEWNPKAVEYAYLTMSFPSQTIKATKGKPSRLRQAQADRYRGAAEAYQAYTPEEVGPRMPADIRRQASITDAQRQAAAATQAEMGSTVAQVAGTLAFPARAGLQAAAKPLVKAAVTAMVPEAVKRGGEAVQRAGVVGSLDTPVPTNVPKEGLQTWTRGAERGALQLVLADALLAGDKTLAATIEQRLKAMPQAPGAEEIERKKLSPMSLEFYETLFGRRGQAAQQMLAEQMGMQLPYMLQGAAGGLTGAAFRSAPLAIAGATAGGAVGEFTADDKLSFVEALRKAGVDLANEQSIEKALTDPAVRDKARRYAKTHAGVVTAIDTLFNIGQMMVAAGAAKPGLSALNRVARLAGAQAIGTTGDFTSEMGAQLATGASLKDPEAQSDIIMEGLLGGLSNAVTTATGAGIGAIANTGQAVASQVSGPVREAKPVYGPAPKVAVTKTESGKFRATIDGTPAGAEYDSVGDATDNALTLPEHQQAALKNALKESPLKWADIVPLESGNGFSVTTKGGVNFEARVETDEFMAELMQRNQAAAAESAQASGATGPVEAASAFTPATDTTPAILHFRENADIGHINHETLHGLVDAGVVTQKEVKALANYGRKNRWAEQTSEDYEAAAYALQNASRIAKHPPSIAKTIFKLADFLRALTSSDYRTARKFVSEFGAGYVQGRPAVEQQAPKAADVVASADQLQANTATETATSTAPEPAAVPTPEQKAEPTGKKEPWQTFRTNYVFRNPDGTYAQDRSRLGITREITSREKLNREIEESDGKRNPEIDRAIEQLKAQLARSDEHRAAVEKAVANGETIPDGVLTDYPDLARQSTPATPQTAPQPAQEAQPAPETPPQATEPPETQDAAQEAVQPDTSKSWKPRKGIPEVRIVDLRKLKVHPEMQYKREEIVDPVNRVTNQFKNVDEFNVDAAGIGAIWEDLNGVQWTGDFHHRREFGLRASKWVRDTPGGTAPVEKNMIPVRVYKEADGWTIDRVRGKFALDNIRDGKGTAVDAARAMKDLGISREDLLKYGVTPRSRLYRNISGLMNLTDDLFGAVVNKTVPEDVAAGIGEIAKEPTQQDMLIRSAVDAGFKSYDEARQYAEDALAENAIVIDGGGSNPELPDLFGKTGQQSLDVLAKRRLLVNSLKNAVAAKRKGYLDPVGVELLEGENIREQDRVRLGKMLGDTSGATKDKLDWAVTRNEDYKATLTDAATKIAQGKATVAGETSRLLGETLDLIARPISEIVGGGQGVYNRGGTEGTDAGVSGTSAPGVAASESAQEPADSVDQGNTLFSTRSLPPADEEKITGPRGKLLASRVYDTIGREQFVVVGGDEAHVRNPRGYADSRPVFWRRQGRWWERDPKSYDAYIPVAEQEITDTLDYLREDLLERADGTKFSTRSLFGDDEIPETPLRTYELLFRDYQDSDADTHGIQPSREPASPTNPFGFVEVPSGKPVLTPEQMAELGAFEARLPSQKRLAAGQRMLSIVPSVTYRYAGNGKWSAYLSGEWQEPQAVDPDVVRGWILDTKRNREALKIKTGATPIDPSNPPDYYGQRTLFATRQAQEDSPEFRAWFGGSKVVDDDGRPKVVYHGTGFSGFAEFDPWAGRHGLFGQGVYMTEDPEIASEYAQKGDGPKQGVYPLYADIKNPLDMDAPADVAVWQRIFPEVGIEDRTQPTTNERMYREVEDYFASDMPLYEFADFIQARLEGGGFDGITHMGGGRRNKDSKRHRVWIAFLPTQVKSATANVGSFSNNPDIRFAVRELPPEEYPTKTVTAYKLFATKRNAPGKLFPLFIGATDSVEPGDKWYAAESLPTKGFAPRPGWHVGELPTAPHLMRKDGTLAPDRVWAEVEIPADVDWQPEANAQPSRDIRDRVPEGGHYRFSRATHQGSTWMIAGALKVRRVLSVDEAAEIAAKGSGDTKFAVRRDEVDQPTLAGLGPVATDPDVRKLIGSINPKYLDLSDFADPKLVLRHIADAVEQLPKEVTQVETWDMTRAKALAKSVDLTPERVRTLLGNHDQAATAAQLTAVAGIFLKLEQEANNAALAYSASSDPRDYAAMVVRQNEFTAALMLASRQSRRAGQALNACKIIKKMIETAGPEPQLMAKLIALQGEIGEAQRAAIEKAGGDPIELYRILREAMRGQHTWGDTIHSFTYFNMLSSVSAHVRNLAGNTSHYLLTEAVVKPVAVGIDAIRGGERAMFAKSTLPYRAAKRAMDAEAMAEFALAMAGAVKSGALMFREGFTEAEAEKMDVRHIRDMPDVTVKGKQIVHPLNYPTRALGASDQIARALISWEAVNEGAVNEAIKELKREGVSKPTDRQIVARAKYIKENLGDYPDIVRDADEYAHTILLTRQIPDYMQAWFKAIDKEIVPGTGFRPAKLVIPFKNVPTNLSRIGAAYTPIGAAVLAFKGKSMTRYEQNMAVSRMIVGTGVIVGAYLLAMSGAIEIEGDDREGTSAEKALRMGSGKKPGSIRIGNNWYSIQEFGPLAPALYGLAAAVNHGDRNMVIEGMRGLWTGIMNASFMSGLKTFVGAVWEGGWQADRLAASTAGQFLPAAGLLGNIANATDPISRDTKRQKDDTALGPVVNQVKGRIPGVRNALPERIDTLGRPIPQSPTGWRAFFPVAGRPATADDPVVEELLSIKYAPGYVGKAFSQDRKSFPMTTEMWREYQVEAGNAVYDALDGLFKGSEYTSQRDPETKRDMARKAAEEARAGVRAQFRAQVVPGEDELPEVADSGRVRAKRRKTRSRR